MRMYGSTAVVFVIMLSFQARAEAAPLTAAFTFQGHLKDGGAPAEGEYDLLFTLWNAGTLGIQLGGPVELENVSVAGGLFSVRLNSNDEFGLTAFDGNERWLEIAVRPGSGVDPDPYTTLAPRQPLDATPYALKTRGIDGHSLDAQDGSPVDHVFVDAAGNVRVGAAGPAISDTLTVNGSGRFFQELQLSPSGGGRALWVEGNPVDALALFDAGEIGGGKRVIDIVLDNDSSQNTHYLICNESAATVFRIQRDGNVFADGAYSGPADFAEMVKVTGGASAVQPGDVLVIDPAAPRRVMKSGTARATLVAGVYSTEPGFVGSEHDWDEEMSELRKTRPEAAEAGSVIEMGRLLDEVPLAVVGIVPCKVTTENGAIRPGDLLVTSNIPGHAMRDDNPRPGTIVGKALESLDSGSGVIRVLVTL